MGGWMKANLIPAEYSTWGTFAELRDNSPTAMRSILESAADSHPAPGSNDQKIGDFYAVMEMETSLAKASRTRVELRDPHKNYNKMTFAQLETLMPGWSWESYLHAMGVNGISEISVGQPDFFKEVDHQLAAAPLTDWKTYLRWHVIHKAAPALSDAFVQENFISTRSSYRARRKWSTIGSPRCARTFQRFPGWDPRPRNRLWRNSKPST